MAKKSVGSVTDSGTTKVPEQLETKDGKTTLEVYARILPSAQELRNKRFIDVPFKFIKAPLCDNVPLGQLILFLPYIRADVTRDQVIDGVWAIFDNGDASLYKNSLGRLIVKWFSKGTTISKTQSARTLAIRTQLIDLHKVPGWQTRAEWQQRNFLLWSNRRKDGEKMFKLTRWFRSSQLRKEKLLKALLGKRETGNENARQYMPVTAKQLTSDKFWKGLQDMYVLNKGLATCQYVVRDNVSDTLWSELRGRVVAQRPWMVLYKLAERIIMVVDFHLNAQEALPSNQATRYIELMKGAIRYEWSDRLLISALQCAIRQQRGEMALYIARQMMYQDQKTALTLARQLPVILFRYHFAHHHMAQLIWASVALNMKIAGVPLWSWVLQPRWLNLVLNMVWDAATTPYREPFPYKQETTTLGSRREWRAEHSVPGVNLEEIFLRETSARDIYAQFKGADATVPWLSEELDMVSLLYSLVVLRNQQSGVNADTKRFLLLYFNLWMERIREARTRWQAMLSTQHPFVQTTLRRVALSDKAPMQFHHLPLECVTVALYPQLVADALSERVRHLGEELLELQGMVYGAQTLYKLGTQKSVAQACEFMLQRQRFDAITSKQTPPVNELLARALAHVNPMMRKVADDNNSNQSIAEKDRYKTYDVETQRIYVQHQALFDQLSVHWLARQTREVSN
jgi:hypothetical protein